MVVITTVVIQVVAPHMLVVVAAVTELVVFIVTWYLYVAVTVVGVSVVLGHVLSISQFIIFKNTSKQTSEYLKEKVKLIIAYNLLIITYVI